MDLKSLLRKPSLPAWAARIRRGRASGFTLVELLAVISIIVVVLALVVMASASLGKSRNLTNAGNHLTDLLAAARQNSMTKNCLTVLIVPSDNNGWDRCILYELRPRADGSAPVTSDWQPASKWETLPTGITIDSSTFVADSSSALLPTPLPTIRFGANTISQYCFVTFMPRGTLYPKTIPAGGNPTLRLAAGTRSGSNVIYTAGAQNGQPTNFYKIIVLTATGVAKVERS